MVPSANSFLEYLEQILRIARIAFETESPLLAPYGTHELRRRLTILSIRVNHQFVRFIECRERNFNGNRQRQSEIVSKFLPLLDEFLQLLLEYDPGMSDLLNVSDHPSVTATLGRARSAPTMARIESFCFLSFLRHMLIADGIVDRNDPAIHHIGLVYIRAFKFRYYQEPLHFLYILLPPSKFPDGQDSNFRFSDRRVCEAVQTRPRPTCPLPAL